MLSSRGCTLSKRKLRPGFEGFKKQMQNSSVFVYYTWTYYLSISGQIEHSAKLAAPASSPF